FREQHRMMRTVARRVMGVYLQSHVQKLHQTHCVIRRLLSPPAVARGKQTPLRLSFRPTHKSRTAPRRNRFRTGSRRREVSSCHPSPPRRPFPDQRLLTASFRYLEPNPKDLGGARLRTAPGKGGGRPKWRKRRGRPPKRGEKRRRR